MLHKIDEIAAPTATSTPPPTTTTSTAATTIMAPTETTGNGTEPTISTHLANATATTEPTTVAAAAASASAVSATEQETVVGSVAVAPASTPLAAEGQATATMAVTANNTPTPLALSAAAALTELATTADGTVAASVANMSQQTAEAQALAETETEPSFDVQMRTQQQQKIRIYHGAKQSAVWRTDSLASNPSINRSDTGSTEAMTTTINNSRGSGGGSCYATAPSLLLRKFSDGSFNAAAAMPRRVSFPESDKELVTGYLEPANPWEKVFQVSSIAEITELYVQSCFKHRTQPLKDVLEHLSGLDLQLTRQPLLSLKGVQLTPNDCEPLEEIFKLIQYKAIDLSECPLNESCLRALCEMIDYYEAANELDISYNKEQMTLRGWNHCTHMVGRSQELQLLNAEGNQISKVGAENLAGALNTSNLHTLKLEHCGLKGPPLTNFCCKLYHNKILKELWLGYNDLDCTDAQHIADMLRFNHSIELIDISNNNIRDEGVKYLVKALIMQATELERRSGLPLKRARAIEDDEPESPAELTAPLQLASHSEQTETHANTDEDVVEVVETTIEEQQATAMMSSVDDEPSADSSCEPAVGILVDVENDADDDNTEDTVRTLRGGNQGGQQQTGQSMLDKLLSMNSDSSSEEATSNISTDTLAAFCSEDISENSNDIYDTAATTTTTTGATAAAATAATISMDETTELLLLSDAAATLDSPSLEQLTPAQQQQQQQQQSSPNERNLCDITPSTEAKTVEPNETCVQNNNNANSHNNINNNNTNNNHNNNLVNNQIPEAAAATTAAASGGSGTIYEVTAEESDCINAGPSGSRPLDMNKNAKAVDDFEDTHSTDSAFESASEGDISRHLPDEFSRLSVSLESTRLDDMAKEMAIETATIASESTECLLVAAEEVATPTPVVHMPQPEEEAEAEVIVAAAAAVSKVTIDAKEKEPSASPCPSPTPTPPPPSTSPGGISSGLRRTESSCAFLNQTTRNRSQSSDSLCSENSLDGSTSAADPHLAEKLTKNDTLSRRHLVDASLEAAQRAPSGLKALALWSNNLSKDCGPHIAELLSRSSSLELLNIGKNCLSNDFVATIKDSLTKNTTLTTLGLQSAHLSAKGIETLASILTFGGNSKLQRIDIRDNKLEVESLNIIAEVLKSNKTITQIDINDEPKRLTIGSDAHLDYTRVLGTVRSMCSRNEKMQAEELELAEMAANVGAGGGGNGSSSSSSNNNNSNGNGNKSNGISNNANSNSSSSSSNSYINRCRGGYYLGSRKISLTCHSRPLVDAVTGTVTAALAVTAMPTPAAKLEVRRKTNARLRSPGPSPPTISPSSSPNRSRFHVSRVSETSSPLTSPLATMPPTQTTTTPRSASSCMSIPSNSITGSGSGIGGASGGLLGSQSSLNAISVLPLPTSSSLPSMASVTSSVQTVKRLSVSPRSRFHVSRIYEDPLTPPIHLPPTPMLKSARKAAAQLAEALGTTTEGAEAAAAMPVSSVIIVEPSPTANDNNNAQHQPSTNGGDDVDGAAAGGEASQKLLPNSPSTSSSSCSTSPTSSATNSSSTDVTDSISSGSDVAPLAVAGKSCPIAVFGDNDITLTKDSAASVALSTAATNSTEENTVAAATPQQQQQQPTTRARKASWIANPTTVDKLLTLFNPSTMFQRSSSPESKNNAAAAATHTNNAQSTTTSAATGGSGDVNVCLMAQRKMTPPSRSNSNNILTPAATAAAAAGGASTAAAAAAITDAGTSFLDTASRQLRDLRKQVFRQNLSFNNSGDCTTTATQQQQQQQLDTTTLATSPVAETPMLLPSSLKRELKENISPEHTINEETLHTLQKLSRVEDVMLKAEAAAELSDMEIVMHSEVSDCMAEVEQESQQQQQQQQQQKEDLGQV